jgi:hypothetical protein
LISSAIEPSAGIRPTSKDCLAIAIAALAGSIGAMSRWLPRSALAVFGVAFAVIAFGLSRTEIFSRLMATEAGSPGHWRLELVPDGRLVATAAGLIALLVMLVWLAVRASLGKGRLTAWPYLSAAAIVTVAMVIVGAFTGIHTGQCDGSVPRWMLPADYNGSGCIELPENWEASLPWSRDDLVCLGLCTDETLPYR